MTNLKLLRMQRGLTQREVAGTLGISEITMSRLECGWFARPPGGIEQKLRQFFGPEWTWKQLMEQPPAPEPERD
ncbi:MAG: helix-turn-helix domain-containing protein [Desulfomonilaceae bacterium]